MDSVISWIVVAVIAWAVIIYTLVRFANKNGKKEKDTYIKLF